MDNDISHAQKAVNDDHEARIAAIEEHLGFQTDETDDPDAVEEDDETTDDEQDGD